MQIGQMDKLGQTVSVCRKYCRRPQWVTAQTVGESGPKCNR